MHWMLLSIALAGPDDWTVPGDIGLPAVAAVGQHEGSIGTRLFSADVAIDSAGRLVVAGLECGSQDLVECDPLLDVRRWDGQRWETLLSAPMRKATLRVSTLEDDTPVVAVEADDTVEVHRVGRELESLGEFTLPPGSVMMSLTTVPELGVAVWNRDTGVSWCWEGKGFTPEPTLTAPGWVRRSHRQASRRRAYAAPR